MRKLFFASTLALAACVSAFGQNQQNPCPSVEITLPGSGNVNKGSEYAVVANVNVGNWEKLQYEWKISHNVPLGENGKAVIYFTATDAIDGAELTITITIKGLPENCQDVFSTSFRTDIVRGTPRTIDEYEAIPFEEEKVRLDKIAAELKNSGDAAVYFIIYPADKETKQDLNNRAAKIKKYLLSKHKISEEKVGVMFGNPTGKTQTRVYVVSAK